MYLADPVYGNMEQLKATESVTDVVKSVPHRNANTTENIGSWTSLSDQLYFDMITYNLLAACAIPHLISFFTQN